MANGTWKIARNRGSAQLPLVIVVVLAIVLVLVGRAQTSAVRPRARECHRLDGADARKRARAAARLRALGRLRERNPFPSIRKISSSRTKMRGFVSGKMRRSSLQDRLKHYRGDVPRGAQSRPEFRDRARDRPRASRPFLETMILDAGKTNGVKPGEAVIDARGMIGRIFISPGCGTSYGSFSLTDLSSRVPVSIVPGNVQKAILAGDDTPMPLLDALSPNVTVKQGDQVISSGDGGVCCRKAFPSGARGRGRQRACGSRCSPMPHRARMSRYSDFRKPPEQLPAAQNELPAKAAGLAPAAPAP